MIGWVAERLDPNVATVRVRCLGPARRLAARGLPVELFRRERADRYRVLVFTKCYRGRFLELARAQKARGGRVVLDFCDHHLYNPKGLPAYEAARKDLLAFLDLADAVVAPTEGLAEAAAAGGPLRSRPVVIPDAVEGFESPWWTRARVAWSLPRRPRLLWFGFHGVPNAEAGMLDILRVADLLTEVSQEHPFELLVVSNDEAKFRSAIAPLPFPTRYRPWRLGEAAAILERSTAVILPISPNPFTLAKSHNRLTTALLHGVPVVADPIPAYEEFRPYCWLGEWRDGLRRVLSGDPEAPVRARAGGAHALRRFSEDLVADAWANLLAPLRAA